MALPPSCSRLSLVLEPVAKDGPRSKIREEKKLNREKETRQKNNTKLDFLRQDTPADLRQGTQADLRQGTQADLKQVALTKESCFVKI